MNEEAITDLFNYARSKGFRGSRSEFVKTIQTDDNAYKDVLSYARSKGFKESESAFSGLIGRTATTSVGKQAPGSAPGASGGLRLPSGLTGAQIRNLAASGKYKELSSVQGSVAGMTNAELDRAAAEISGKSPEEAARYFKVAAMGGTRGYRTAFEKVGEPQQGIQAPSPMVAAPQQQQASPQIEAGREALLRGGVQSRKVSSEIEEDLSDEDVQGRQKLRILSPQELAGGARQEMAVRGDVIPERQQLETEAKQERKKVAYQAVDAMTKQKQKDYLAKAAEKSIEYEEDELDLGPYGKISLGENEQQVEANRQRALNQDDPFMDEIVSEIKRRNQDEDEKVIADNLDTYFKSNEQLQAVINDSKQRMSDMTQAYQAALEDPTVTDSQLEEMKANIAKELVIQRMGGVVDKIQFEKLPIGEQYSYSVGNFVLGAKGIGLLMWDSVNRSAQQGIEQILLPMFTEMGFVEPGATEEEARKSIEGLVIDPVKKVREGYSKELESRPYQTITNQSILEGVNLLNVGMTAGQVTSSIGAIAVSTMLGGPYAAYVAGGAMVYGDSYDEAKKAGFDETEATIFAGVNAGISGMLEAFGFKGISKAITSTSLKNYVRQAIRSEIKSGKSKDVIIKEILGRVANSGRGFLAGGMPEGFTEAGQAASDLGLKIVFNELALDEGKPGFEIPNIENASKLLLENFIVGLASGGVGPGTVGLFSKGNVKYEDAAKAVVNGRKSVGDIVETTKALIATGQVTAADGRAFIENLKIAEAAKASVPKYVTNKEQRVRAISLIMERNSINKSMEGADPDLQDGYKSRLEEIKSELKSIADKKWVAPVSPVITSSVAGFETAMDALTTDNDSQKSARIFNATVQSQNNGLLTKVVSAMNSGKAVSGVLLDKMAERLQTFADRLDASVEKTPELQKAIATARDLAQKMANYNVKVESETNGTIPGLNMPNAMARIEAGVEAGEIDFMENTPDEIAATFSDIVDGNDVSEQDAKTVADFLYSRYSQLVELKQNLTNKLNNATSEAQIKKYKNAIFGIDEVLKVLDTDINTAVKYQQEKALQDEVAGTRRAARPTTTTRAAEPQARRQAEPTQEYDPANEQEVMDNYKKENFGDQLAAPILKALNTVTKLLAKIAPDVKIYAHTTIDAFEQALLDEGVNENDIRRDDRGKVVIGKNGRIQSLHINLPYINVYFDKDGVKGIFHEAAHVILDVYFKENADVYRNMAKAIRKVLPVDAAVELSSFLDRYRDETEEVKTEEYIVELVELLAKSESQLDNTTRSKIIKAINDAIQKAANALGLTNVDFLLIKDTKADFIDFINSTAVAVRTGLESDISKRATEKIQKKYAVQEQTTGEVPVRTKAKASRGVAQGEPQAEPQGVTEEGKAKEKVEEFRLADVLFTTATQREISEKTKKIKEDTNKFDKLVKSAGKNIWLKPGFDAFKILDKLSSEILDTYKNLITSVSDKLGIKYISGNYFIGSWQGSFEPSMNISFKITDSSNTAALSDLFNSISEETSQDAYIIETLAVQNDEFEKTGKIILYTELDNGTSIYPQVRVEFTNDLNLDQKSYLANALNDSGIKEFSIGDDFVKISSFAGTEQDYSQEKTNFENVIKNSDLSELYKQTTEQIRQSAYIQGDKDGDKRKYDRSDVFEAFKPSKQSESKIRTKSSRGAAQPVTQTGEVAGRGEQRVQEQKQVAKPGNRLFNNPLQEVATIANEYFQKAFGRTRPEYNGSTKLDTERAKRISDAFIKMKHDPNNPNVKKAYQALAKETLDQYNEMLNAGYFVEINNDEPYANSQEMIDDLRENNRIKIFSTESGFGDEPITDKQRKENPLLEDSGFKDVNGQKMLVNDVFRAVHDFFGHAELGNSFGPKGEENAWNVHSRMYSPEARKAMTTETRGQNSFVNFSGVNNEIENLRNQARALREQGREEDAQDIVNQIYNLASFADQKIGLLPEEFYLIDENDTGDLELKKEPVQAEPTAKKETTTLDGRDYDTLTETQKEEIKASSVSSDPVQLRTKSSRGATESKVEFKEGGYKNSYVKKSDIIDFQSFLNKVADEGAKIWFWTADQLGIGVYSDETVNGEHYLDAGPSFALDPKNRKMKVIWSSGLKTKTLKDKISESDYIFIISGHPSKAKLFNKTVIDYLKDRIEKSSNESFMSFAKKMIDLDIRNTQISEILKKYKSYFEFRNSKGSDKKELINLLSSQLDKKQTPIKKYLDTIGLNFDVNNLRDGFYSENNFGINDVMLVLKATGVGGKSNHSTYENNILGEVIGVPDIKVNAADIVSEERRKRLGKIDAKKTPITAQTGYFIETIQPGLRTKASRGAAPEGMGYNPNLAADRGSGQDRDLQQSIYDAAQAIWDRVKGMDIIDSIAYIYDEVKDKTGVELNPVQTSELIKDLKQENRPEYKKDQSGKYRRQGPKSRAGSVMSNVLAALDQLATDRRVNKSIISGLKNALKGGPQYTVEHQLDAEAIRDTIFDIFNGVSSLEAAEQIYQLAELTTGGLRSSMLARLTNDAWNKAREAKTQEERTAYRNIGQRAILQLSDEATKAGQFNSMIYRIQKLNPEFIVQLEINKVRNQTTEAMSSPGKKKRRVQAVTSAVNQSQTQAAQQASQSASVQSAISTATGSSPTITSQPTQKSTSQKKAQSQAPTTAAPLTKIQEADKRIKDLKKKLADRFGGLRTKSSRVLPAGMDAEILDIITELARNYIIKGYTDKAALLAKVSSDVAAAGGNIGINYYNQMWVEVSAEAYAQANKNNAASLAGRIVGRVKQEVNPNPKTLDPIAEMIDALFKKATEDLPELISRKASSLDKLISLLQNFDQAKAAWEYSKGIVEAKIDALDDTRFSPQDKQRMKDMLDSFFQNDLSPFEIKATPYSVSEKSVGSTLKEQMKDKKMLIEEILLLSNTKQAATKQEFIDSIVHDIVAATGISNTHATKIAEAFADKYDAIVTSKQESILRRYLPAYKNVQKFKRKSTAQRAFEMIKYGALDPSIAIYDKDGNIVETAKLLAEMLEIPYIDAELANDLNVYAEAIADTPVGVLRTQVMNDMMLHIKMHQYRIQGSIGDRYMSTVYANMLTSMDTMLKAFNSNVLMYNTEFITQVTRSAAKGDFSLIPLLVRGFYKKKGVGVVETNVAKTSIFGKTMVDVDVDGYVINTNDEYYVIGPKKVIMSMANPKAVALSGHYEGLLRYSMGINNARAILKNVILNENFTNNVTAAVYEKKGKGAAKVWGKYAMLAQKGLGALDALTTAAATQARFSDLLFDLIKTTAKNNGYTISGREIADAVNMIQGYDAMVQLDALNQAIAEMEEVEEGKVDLSDSRKKALVLARMEEIVVDKMSDRFQAAAAQHPWMASLDMATISDLLDQSREVASKIGLMGPPPGTGGILSHLLGLPGKTIRFSNVQYGAFTNAPINAAVFITQGNTPIAALVTLVRLIKNKRGLNLGSKTIEDYYKKIGARTEMYGEARTTIIPGVERNLEKEDMLTRFMLIQVPVIGMTYMGASAILSGIAGAYAGMGDDDEEKEKNKEISELIARDGIEYLREIPQNDRELVFFGDKLAKPGSEKYEGVWKSLPIYVTSAMHGYSNGGYAKMMSIKSRFGIEPYTVYAYGKKIFSYKDNPALGAFFMQMGAVSDALLFNESAEIEDTQNGVIMMSALTQLNLIKDQANLRSIAELTELFGGQKAYEGVDSYWERSQLYLSKTAGNIVNTSVMPAELKNLNQDILAVTGASMDDPKTFMEFAVYRWPVVSSIVIEKDKTGPFGYPVKTAPKRVFPIGTEQFKLPLMVEGTLNIPTVDELLATEDAKCLYLFERMKNDKYAKMDISSYYQIDKYGNYDKKTFTKDEISAMREEYKLIMRDFALKNMEEKSSLMFDANLKVYLALYGQDKGYTKFGYKRYIIDKVLGDKAKNIILDSPDEILNIQTMGMTQKQIDEIMEKLKPIGEE